VLILEFLHSELLLTRPNTKISCAISRQKKHSELILKSPAANHNKVCAEFTEERGINQHERENEIAFGNLSRHFLSECLAFFYKNISTPPSM